MEKPGARPRVNVDDIEALLDEHQSALIGYAYRLVRSRELAEDMVQEAFLRYIRQPLEYGEPRQRTAWLYRVTHNLCIDWLKRETKRNEIYDRIRKQTGYGIEGAGVVAMDRWQYFERLLDRLSEKQKHVIVLFFHEGLSYKEISEVTGYSMSNVGMLLHRGLKRLRKMIDNERVEEAP